jgi:hypothetical protein
MFPEYAKSTYEVIEGDLSVVKVFLFFLWVIAQLMSLQQA